MPKEGIKYFTLGAIKNDSWNREIIDHLKYWETKTNREILNDCLGIKEKPMGTRLDALKNKTVNKMVNVTFKLHQSEAADLDQVVQAMGEKRATFCAAAVMDAVVAELAEMPEESEDNG